MRCPDIQPWNSSRTGRVMSMMDPGSKKVGITTMFLLFSNGAFAAHDGPGPNEMLSLLSCNLRSCFLLSHCLVGLVVWASPLRAADPGFSSYMCCADFSGSSHTSDLKICTPVATLPGAQHYRVRAGIGWPGDSILWLGEIVWSATSVSVWQHAKLSRSIQEIHTHFAGTNKQAVLFYPFPTLLYCLQLVPLFFLLHQTTRLPLFP